MNTYDKKLKKVLDSAYHEYNTTESISIHNPDPLLKVYEYKSHPNLPYIALICALFSYGNVRAIMRFLDSLPFGALDSKEQILGAHFPYYRFQSAQDVRALFLAVYEFKRCVDFSDFIALHYRNGDILSLIREIIKTLNLHLNRIQNKQGRGLAFLIGALDSSSPLKRWNMFLRWMVRKDNIDLGIWSHIIKSRDLLLPLDTHTFRMCQNLRLLKRKSYDIKAVLEVSQNLLKFDSVDPIRYDFALYRIGQKYKASKNILQDCLEI